MEIVACAKQITKWKIAIAFKSIYISRREKRGKWSKLMILLFNEHI